MRNAIDESVSTFHPSWVCQSKCARGVLRNQTLPRIEWQKIPLPSFLFCNQSTSLHITSHQLHSNARPHFHFHLMAVPSPLPDRAIIIVTLTSPGERQGRKNSGLELQPATDADDGEAGEAPTPYKYLGSLQAPSSAHRSCFW